MQKKLYKLEKETVMASLNKIMLIGNLGKDPEMRYLPNGDAVCNITVATSEQWKDKQTGDKKESTEWHRVVFFRRLAEIAGEYLKKGSSVYVEGSIKTKKWQDKDGNDRYTTEIVGNEMKMLGGKNTGESQQAPQVERPQAQSAQPKKGSTFEDMDDDIPF